MNRFWSRVNKDGPEVRAGLGKCWLWVGDTFRGRYGRFWYGGESLGAHVVSFFLANGRWADPQVNHECDVPLCVNPAHLREGTQSKNRKDAFVRGRVNQYGERNPTAKLTDSQVDEIRSAVASGRRRLEVAGAYGVSRSMVDMIVNGQRRGRAA